MTTTKAQTAAKMAKRLQRARNEVAAVMLRAQDFMPISGSHADEAGLQMATALNWIDAAIIELGRIEKGEV